MINYQELKLIKLNIENLLNNNNFEEATAELAEYKKKYPYDLDICSLESYIYCSEGNFDNAEDVLVKAYSKNEYNPELNYNLATVFYYKKEYLRATKFLFKSILLDNDKTLQTSELLEKLTPFISDDTLKQIKYELSLYNDKLANYYFPKVRNIDNTESRIKQLSYNNKNYYCGIYDYYVAERDGIILDSTPQLIPLNKYEIMPYTKTKCHEFKTTENTLIPLLVQTDKQIIDLNINDENLKLKGLLDERFYYYKIAKNSNVKITSNDDFILGEKIKLEKNEKLPSLILNIFVDGLSQKFINDNNLKELAPNIYNFFKKGTKCTNAHTIGEWTYTSIAGAFTGMHTTNHRIYHPQYSTNNLLNYELYSEIFNRAGFHCTKIDEDYRSNPALGYMKGFDRYLYQSASRGMFANDVVMETIENIEAFKDTNNFMWICIPDLHDVAEAYEEPISAQVNTNIKSRPINKKNAAVTTVRQTYNPYLIERYRSQLKRIDVYLGLLFDYLKRNYCDDDIVVSLMSDHGQGYLIKSDEFLDEQRSNIAMMFRGKGIPEGTCTELISLIDLFPIILNSIGITDYEKKESIIPKYFGGKCSRAYTYTESLHSNFQYYAVINDLKYKFFFTTTKENTNDGRVYIASESDFYYKLIHKNTQRDETKENPELVKHYTNIVLDHIREYIII